MNDKLKVLVVDDEDYIRSFFIDFLETLGHNCITAKDGQEALTILEEKNWEFDIIFSDILMPRLDGIALLKKIKQKIGDKIKVILMTGYVDNYKNDDIFGIKEDGFIKKPFDISIIEKILEDLKK